MTGFQTQEMLRFSVIDACELVQATLAERSPTIYCLDDQVVCLTSSQKSAAQVQSESPENWGWGSGWRARPCAGSPGSGTVR